MSADAQHTLASAATLEGTSLHTGAKVTLTLKPAPADHGFKFRRVDLPDQPFIDADADKVQTVERATTLAEGSVKVHTVEHVLSALTGMGVDNAIIEMDANEPPIGDGSSRPFVELIKKAGLAAQDAPRKIWEIREPIHQETGDGSLITIVPSKTFRVSVTNVGPMAASPSTSPARSHPNSTKRKSHRPVPSFTTRTSSRCWKRSSSRAARLRTPSSSAAMK